jgi:hypothetical protein
LKTIIAGSRNITDYSVLETAIAASSFTITEVISGGARGVDSLGEWFANKNNLPLTIMNAEWGKYGKSAGIRRNEEMAEVGEALIALWDGESRGTAHMINCARRKGLEVFVWQVEQ